MKLAAMWNKLREHIAPKKKEGIRFETTRTTGEFQAPPEELERILNEK